MRRDQIIFEACVVLVVAALWGIAALAIANKHDEAKAADMRRIIYTVR